jgi:hypothetical protein
VSKEKVCPLVRKMFGLVRNAREELIEPDESVGVRVVLCPQNKD